MNGYGISRSRGDAETQRILASLGLHFPNTVIARSKATKQSRVALTNPGLLRFARHDDSYLLGIIQKILRVSASLREPVFGYYICGANQ
jgi:hypothetical protein